MSKMTAKGIKIPPKKQVEVLCHCPQKCDTKVPQDVRQWFFAQFQAVDDRTRQNAWLQSQMEMRSVYKRLWSGEDDASGKLQRRVSCKYKVPTSVPKTLYPKPNDKVSAVEVCMKAFMNVYGVTEKRIRLQRERMITELRKEMNDEVTLELASLESLPQSIIDVVDNFFINQLWKPEQMGVNENKVKQRKQTLVEMEKESTLENDSPNMSHEDISDV